MSMFSQNLNFNCYPGFCISRFQLRWIFFLIIIFVCWIAAASLFFSLSMPRGKKITFNDREGGGEQGDNTAYQNLLECVAISDDSEDEKSDSSSESEAEDDANIAADTVPGGKLDQNITATSTPITQPALLTMKPGQHDGGATIANSNSTKVESKVPCEKMLKYPPVSLTKDKIRELIDNVAKNNKSQKNKQHQQQTITLSEPVNAQHAPPGQMTATQRAQKRNSTEPIPEILGAQKKQSNGAGTEIFAKPENIPCTSKRFAIGSKASAANPAVMVNEIGVQTEKIDENSALKNCNEAWAEDEGKRVFEGGGKLIKDDKVCDSIHAVVDLALRGRFVVTHSHHLVLTDKHYNFEVVGGCLDNDAFLSLDLNLTGTAPCSVAVPQLPTFK